MLDDIAEPDLVFPDKARQTHDMRAEARPRRVGSHGAVHPWLLPSSAQQRHLAAEAPAPHRQACFRTAPALCSHGRNQTGLFPGNPRNTVCWSNRVARRRLRQSRRQPIATIRILAVRPEQLEIPRDRRTNGSSSKPPVCRARLPQ